jgi:hypothetical protein
MGLMEGATGEKILDREYRRSEFPPMFLSVGVGADEEGS